MELPSILKRMDDFKKLDVKVAISNNETLEIANSKYQLYEFMKDKRVGGAEIFLGRFCQNTS